MPSNPTPGLLREQTGKFSIPPGRSCSMPYLPVPTGYFLPQLLPQLARPRLCRESYHIYLSSSLPFFRNFHFSPSSLALFPKLVILTGFSAHPSKHKFRYPKRHPRLNHSGKSTLNKTLPTSPSQFYCFPASRLQQAASSGCLSPSENLATVR